MTSLRITEARRVPADELPKWYAKGWKLNHTYYDADHELYHHDTFRTVLIVREVRSDA